MFSLPRPSSLSDLMRGDRVPGVLVRCEYMVVRACVRACMRACVRACVRACMRLCVCVGVCGGGGPGRAEEGGGEITTILHKFLV